MPRKNARTFLIGSAAASATALLFLAVHAGAEDRSANSPAVAAVNNAPVEAPAAIAPSAAPADSQSAPSESPPAPADSQSAPAGSSAAPAAPPPPPPFDRAPFSEEHTKVPAAAEWKAAEVVTLDPMGHAPTACTGKRVREWVRLTCTGTSVGAVRMLGGKKDGLQVHFHNLQEEFQTFPEGVDIAFPVRPGDQRVIEVMQVDFGYHGSQSVSPWFVLSELWPEGEASPAIAIH